MNLWLEDASLIGPFCWISTSQSPGRASCAGFVQSGSKIRMERLSDEFFEQVRRGYLEIARAEPDRVKIIDASGTEDQVEEAIWKEIDGVLT